MSLGLIISRFGRIGDKLTKNLSLDDLYDLTKSQTDNLASDDVFYVINDEVDRVVKQWDPAASEVVSQTTPYGDEQIFSSDRRHPLLADDFKTYTSILPDRRITLRLEKQNWFLRTRASFAISTSALEPPRLWWTTEGIPVPDHSSGRHTPVRFGNFIELANQIEAAAMDALQAPFNTSLAESHLRSKLEFNKSFDRTIRIRLADNDSRPFAKLTDAMFFSDLLPSQIYQGRELEGLQSLKKFVDDASAQKVQVSDKSAKLYRDKIPGVSSVVCRGFDPSSTMSIAVGFARSATAGHAYQIHDPRPFDVQENYTRTISAARRFSAYLADLEARTLTGSLPVPAHN